MGNLLIRSYKRSFNGFAAKLTETERQKLAGKGSIPDMFNLMPWILTK